MSYCPIVIILICSLIVGFVEIQQSLYRERHDDWYEISKDFYRHNMLKGMGMGTCPGSKKLWHRVVLNTSMPYPTIIPPGNILRYKINTWTNERLCNESNDRETLYTHYSLFFFPSLTSNNPIHVEMLHMDFTYMSLLTFNGHYKNYTHFRCDIQGDSYKGYDKNIIRKGENCVPSAFFRYSLLWENFYEIPALK